MGCHFVGHDDFITAFFTQGVNYFFYSRYIVILRYFDDFRKTGKMNYEEVHGEKYYWISYQNIERELPFLDLNRRSIMKRMHKLRDAGILKDYTRRKGEPSLIMVLIKIMKSYFIQVR